MASFPRYTTYGAGELEERLRGLDRGSRLNDTLPSPTGSSPTGLPTQERSATGLLTQALLPGQLPGRGERRLRLRPLRPDMASVPLWTSGQGR